MNFVHEDLLPDQKRDAHFLPVGQSVPNGINIIEDPVSCLFLVYIHNPSREPVNLCLEQYFIFLF